MPALVLGCVERAGQSARLTPYQISKSLGMSAGSVTAACKALAERGEVRLYGTSPYMVGPLESVAQ